MHITRNWNSLFTNTTARSSTRLFPEIAHGRALEDDEKGEESGEGDDDGESEVDDEFVNREDGDIEEKGGDGEAYEDSSNCIEEFAEPPVFESYRDIRQGFDVDELQAVAIFYGKKCGYTIQSEQCLVLLVSCS